MPTKKKARPKKKKTVTKKVPSSAAKKGARAKRTLNAEEYVRSKAQKSRVGCRVCCYPNIKKKLDEIGEQMDKQRVKIPGAELLRDLKKLYDGFTCSDDKFRKHIRECMEREL